MFAQFWISAPNPALPIAITQNAGILKGLRQKMLKASKIAPY
jgi:hypothetical protein